METPSPFATSWRWFIAHGLPVLVPVVLATLVALGGPLRTQLWFGGYHATPDQFALHAWAVDLFGADAHHQSAPPALAIRSSTPAIYNGLVGLAPFSTAGECALLLLVAGSGLFIWRWRLGTGLRPASWSSAPLELPPRFRSGSA